MSIYKNLSYLIKTIPTLSVAPKSRTLGLDTLHRPSGSLAFLALGPVSMRQFSTFVHHALQGQASCGTVSSFPISPKAHKSCGMKGSSARPQVPGS